MEEILHKHFRNEKVLYYHSSDAHKRIEGETYLKYESSMGKIELWFGGENGEVCLLCTNDSEKLDKAIMLLTY